MFEIKEETFEGTGILKLEGPSGQYLTIIPSCGACTHELVLEKGGQLYPILYPESSPDPLLEGISFKGSKLTPFPNRINRGRYAFEGKEYQLPINFKDGNAIHGLLYNMPFEVAKTYSTKDEAVAILNYSCKGAPGFPFSFLITITHTLSQNGIAIKTEVTNTGRDPMPYGDGWHPYFTLGRKIDELTLGLPATKKIIVDEHMIPTGALQDFTYKRLIDKDEFDTGFMTEMSAETLISDGKATISVWQDAAYPYLQVYTPKHREAIAIEPMSCMTDAFNNKNGLVVLKPGETWIGTYGVQLK